VIEHTIAAISDIHGNRWALEAVLRDIDVRGITEIVNLGDCFYGPLDPTGTADLLLPRMIPSVRGNEDRLIIETGKSSTPDETILFVKKSLSQLHYDWLKSLKTILIQDDIYLCHGTPSSDTEYLLWEVLPDGRVQHRTESDVESLIGDTQSSLLLCGHSHVPCELSCSNGNWVIDPGSVGLQAFTDDRPIDHRMKAGSPHARYSIIRITGDDIRVQRIEVEYDWNTAASVAKRNGRDDWAAWLKTGTA
jgi:predicted phosphodiesterase